MGAVPATVKRNRHVRHGSAEVSRFVVDKKGSAAALRRLADERANVQAILDDQGTSEELRTAARAWLDDDPGVTPRDAAAAFAALAGCIRYPEDDSVLVGFADVWIARHGLLFAARAAVEQMLFVCPERMRPDPSRIGPIFLSTLDRHAAEYRSPRVGVLLRVRAAVAAATDAEYAELVEALRQYRDRHWDAAVAVGVLLPGERDWVERDVRVCLADRTLHEHWVEPLLLAAGTVAQAVALAPLINQGVSLRTLHVMATVADGLGSGAVTVLLSWFDQQWVSADVQRRVLSILVELDDDSAFTALLDRADRKFVPAALLDAAARFPARAMRLFAEAGSPMLRAHVLAHPGLMDEVLPALGPAAAELVRELAAGAVAVRFAPPAAVPQVLATPPWQDRAAAAKQAVISGLTCDDGEVIRWRAGERERWLGLGRAGRTEMHWDEFVRPTVSDGYAELVLTGAPEEIVRPLLPTYRVNAAWYLGEWVKVVAARFELDALPFVRDAAARSTGLADALQPYCSPEIAAFMADRYARSKRARPAALAWLLRHADAAARALVPAAVGKAGTARRQAETALLALPAATVRSAATGYGPAVSAAVDALLARDPLTLLPARLPARPAWVVPALLPQVRLRDDSGALPPAAVEALITMLAISTMDDPYAGVALAAEACAPDDLTEFAWGLFDAWQQAGADPKQLWVLDALALLGDDTTVRRLTPLILAWPGEGGHAKAVTGVRVLAAIGTDVALMRLYGISQRATFKGLKTAAVEKMDEVADALGLTVDQLADRLVPDFGLDADGSLTLDYGNRQFVVGFDEHLKPTVSDSSGKRLKALPKPPATPAAEAAAKRFAALRKDVRTVAADQVRRLEQAMVSGRRWTPEEFTRYFSGHPLLVHIVRRLVWSVSDGGAFRVAEDSSLADVADEPYTLPAGVTVAVAHPIGLGDDLAGWREVFTSYEILQPFPQLDRDTYDKPDEQLVRLTGAVVPTTRLLGLERRGWRREAPQDAGVQSLIERVVGDLTVVVQLEHGIVVGEPGMFPEQRLEEIYVHDGTGDGWRHSQGRRPFAALGAASASEVVRDLMIVAGLSPA